MARNRKWRTDREPPLPEQMKLAVIDIVQNGCPIKTTAVKYNIKRTTLRRYVQKYKAAENKEVVKYTPSYDCQRIFSDQQEHMLADYLVTAANHHYGLSTASVRTLAMEFAMKNHLSTPENWLRDSSAGQEWLIGFMHRHPQLSVRVPEAMSSGRSTAFNKFTVDKFMDNLQQLHARYGFGAERIYNSDETAVTMVQKPHKIIASKGSK
jgi:Tc5 transposase DNA-binding domain